MATGVDNKSPSYFLRRSNDGVCVMGGEGEWRDRSRCAGVTQISFNAIPRLIVGEYQ